jgi:hypothetical protein
MYVCIYVCMYVRTYLCTYVCMCVYIYIYIYNYPQFYITLSIPLQILKYNYSVLHVISKKFSSENLQLRCWKILTNHPRKLLYNLTNGAFKRILKTFYNIYIYI